LIFNCQILHILHSDLLNTLGYDSTMNSNEESKAFRYEIEELKDRFIQLSQKQDSQYVDIILHLKKIEDMLDQNKVNITDNDELYEDAKAVVIKRQVVLVSLLQRVLDIGYARAAQIMDLLEKRGIVEKAKGVNPRKIFVKGGEE